MAGTKNYVELTPGFRASFILAASGATNSLQGVDTSGLQNGAVCFVEENGSAYRYDDTSVLPASTTVVVPISGVGRWLMISSPLAETLVTFPQLRVGAAANAPALGDTGPTTGWIFTLPAPPIYLYAEVPIPKNVVRDTDLTLGLAWAPTGAEAGTVASWQADVGFEKAGSVVSSIDFTVQAIDQAVPSTLLEYARTPLVVPSAQWAADTAVDELHVRITRIASTTDPVADPGVHHLAAIWTVVP